MPPSLPCWSGWRSLVGKRHSIHYPPHSGQIGKWLLSASQIAGSERYRSYQPGPPKASWGVGKEQGWKQGENENRWGRGVDWGGLTAFLVLLCGDSAGQRAQRGKNRASEECLLSRSKEHPWGQRKSWSQSPNHPLYHPGPSPAGRWENRVFPHGGQQLQESRTLSLGYRGRLYRQN